MWRRFVDERWERRTWLTPDAPGALGLTADDVFDQLSALGGGEASLRGHVRFYRGLDLTPETSTVKRFLPRSEDGDWAGYRTRLEREMDGADWMLVVNNLQELDFDVWERARTFLSPLLDALDGMPARGIELTVFCGRYGRTAFGVHQDSASTFMFVLVGEKTMLTWPGETEGIVPGTVDYERLRPDATLLTGRPGLLAYWPSSAWHVAESPRFSVSVQVPLFFEPEPWRPFLERLRRSALPALATETLVPRAQGTEAQLSLPPHLATPQALLAEALRAEESQARLIESWMRRTSACGFRAVPAPKERRSIDLGATVTADARFPILVAQTAPSIWSCCANGHLLRVREQGPGLIRLVHRLNEGRPSVVRDLVELQSSDVSAGEALHPEDVVKLLEVMATWRAVAVETA